MEVNNLHFVSIVTSAIALRQSSDLGYVLTSLLCSFIVINNMRSTSLIGWMELCIVLLVHESAAFDCPGALF